MEHTPLDTAPLDALLTEVDQTPEEVDGLDLRTRKQEARIILGQARNALMCLRKLARPDEPPAE